MITLIKGTLKVWNICVKETLLVTQIVERRLEQFNVNLTTKMGSVAYIMMLITSQIKRISI